MNYRALFEPITLGNTLRLQNRIVCSAIHLMYETEGYLAGDRLVAYYRRRANSGVGLMIVGGCAVDQCGHAEHMLSLATEDTVPGLKRLTDAIHTGESKIAVQLYHSGRYARMEYNGGAQAIAPSAIASTYTGELPREMTLEDIEFVKRRFCEAAQRARRAGFDAVEVIGSAGYLISQFFSPITNHRTDAYGGNAENRRRFGAELIAGIRASVGPDYPILVRLSGNEFMSGGNDNQAVAQFARTLEQAGASCIHVTGGWHETLVPQVSGEVPQGAFAYLAAGVKREVSVPVIASNRINTAQTAERILATGAADLVNMGRQLITDPDFARKIREGHEDQVRYCIGCNQGCMDRCFSGFDVNCSLNPFSGREEELVVTPAKTPKKVLVVGGGVAGMEAAIYAKQRGHDVSLWEQSGRLGGQLRYAALPPGKHDFHLLVRQQETMLNLLKVPVFLNRKATPQSVDEAKPDLVIDATGAVPNEAPFPVEPGAQVVQAIEVLSHSVFAGQNVVVVGGGAVGCETALFLAQEARPSADTIQFLMEHRAETPEFLYELLDHPTRHITIVEFADRIGNGIGKSTKWAVKKNLARLGIDTMVRTQVLSVQDGYLCLRSRDTGEEHRIAADTVVLSIGSHPEHTLSGALGDRYPIYQIGDAVKARTIRDCLTEAVELALRI